MFGSASTAPQLETKFLASLAPPMLACAAPGKYISRTAALLARSPLFEKFSLKEIFKGCCLLFSYQGSCRSLSSDSFNSLSKLFRFVKNFFLFLLSLTGQLKYITTFHCHMSTIFYKFFQLFFPAFPDNDVWYFRMISSTTPPFYTYPALAVLPVSGKTKTTGYLPVVSG